MFGQSSEVLVHGEQFVISGNRQHSDKTVGAGCRKTGGQTLVCEAGSLDVIPGAWIDDAERGKQSLLQIRELFLVPDPAQNLLQDYPRQPQG
ncbi:MAG TPA: hypothetical protein VGQ81_17150 [Acidobacteriota bacterium]|nr:hypothetical protein [Acidobacteriota bacterium]